MNHRAPGFTLVELLAVVVIAVLIMGAVMQTLVVQQRGYRQQSSITNARQSSRMALDLLTVELRELSARDGDLLMAEEDSIRFRSFLKVGIVCEMPSTADELKVGVVGDALFAPGDSVLVFIEDGNVWERDRVTAVEESSCGPATAWKLSLSTGVAATEGAPVRGYRQLSYGAFQLNGQTMLGRRDVDGTVPLLGPLADGGLKFRYYDVFGNETSVLADTHRIDVLVRGMSLGTGSAAQREYVDSLSLQINLRGN